VRLKPLRNRAKEELTAVIPLAAFSGSETCFKPNSSAADLIRVLASSWRLNLSSRLTSEDSVIVVNDALSA
jgi:hypothetical protein